MKTLTLVLSLSAFVGNVFASEFKTVNSAAFVRENKQNIIKVNYNTGGCDSKANKPAIKLEHLSTEDVTPEWAIERDPTTIREYQVTFQAKVVELGDSGLCAMAYRLDAVGNIDELFKEVAPSLGIDLAAKKGHYNVKVLAPSVVGHTFFSGF